MDTVVWVYNETSGELNGTYIVGVDVLQLPVNELSYSVGIDVEELPVNNYVYLVDMSFEELPVYEFGYPADYYIELNINGSKYIVVNGNVTYVPPMNITVEDILLYEYMHDYMLKNSSEAGDWLGYSYDYSVGVYGSYVFVRCLGWSAVAKVYVNNTVFENRYAGVCYAVKPGEAVIKINPPGLYTPEQLFTLLLFIAIIILFSKLIDPYVAFAIACGTMMIISIIYYKDTNMFFLFLFGMTISLALRNYLR